MNVRKGSVTLAVTAIFLMSGSISNAQGQDYYGQEDPNKKILKQGLLGAATGAVAAEASGGKAGKGALVGAGTNVIGGALLDSLTTPSQPAPQQVQYVQQAPQQAYVQQGYPVQTQTYRTVEAQPVYVTQGYQQPYEDPNKKILKQGLLGAGTGAIAASASGGKAGKGALIGAGTNVIGSALLDSLTGSSQPPPQQVVYVQQPAQQYAPQYSQQAGVNTAKKKIVRKYDKDGNVVSEEEVWE